MSKESIKKYNKSEKAKACQRRYRERIKGTSFGKERHKRRVELMKVVRDDTKRTGVRGYWRWEKDEIELLLLFVQEGFPHKYIAKKLRRSLQAIDRKVVRIGIAKTKSG